MPAEMKKRRITSFPPYSFFKPPRIPIKKLRIISLTFEEYEAIRLVDFQSILQRHAAELMEVSQSTLNRILNSARKKVAKMLVLGQALALEGGTISLKCRVFKCNSCSFQWTPKEDQQTKNCIKCASLDINQLKIN